MTRRVIWSALFTFVMIAIVTVVIAYRTPHKLNVHLKTETADLGIPGITKTYEASISNDGLLPIRITRCNFVDDGGGSGTEVSYALQRWSKVENHWRTVRADSPANFCKPYPLGIVQAKLTTTWLWPGQSLSTGEEATAAREPFQIGDHARFVIFTSKPGDYNLSAATDEFTIDEHPTSDVDFRVRH
jgi:hypothetical protein